MPTKLVAQPSNFVVDPERDGIANALWYAISGTLALAGTTPEKFRFNTDDAIVRADLTHATIEFSAIFPTTGAQTPTDLTDDIAFGFKSAVIGTLGKIDFFVDQSGDKAYLRSYDDFGTKEETEITWDTDWNNAQTIFGIDWFKKHVTLWVIVNGATSKTHLATHKVSIPTRALNPFVNVVGADNLDINFIAIRNAQTSSIMLI